MGHETVSVCLGAYCLGHVVNESESESENVLTHESENGNRQGKRVAKCMCPVESGSGSADGAEEMKVLAENGNASVGVYVKAHRGCGCHSMYGSAHGNENVPIVISVAGM